MCSPTSATASVDEIRSHTGLVIPTRQLNPPVPHRHPIKSVPDDSRPSVANTTNLSSPSSADGLKLLYVTSGLAVT
jgi:hypothetical protein